MSPSAPKLAKNQKSLRPGENQIRRAEVDILAQKITDLIRKSPQKAARILAMWIKNSK